MDNLAINNAIIEFEKETIPKVNHEKISMYDIKNHA